MANFAGEGRPLSQNGFDAARTAIGVEDVALWAVLSVETSGCGFLADRRPKILFERHIFHRLTNGRFDAVAPDISAPSSGGYGQSGAPQYARLESAVRLDEDAALQSASWGLGQIMGENHKAAGFADVKDLVTAMVESEDGQLRAMANFIEASAMAPALRSRDWAQFARRYNGPNFAQNNYDGQLQNFCSLFTTGKLPDLRVRAAQVYLTYRGFSPHGIDGVAGENTSDAVKAFQSSMGAAPTGTIDDGLLDALARSA
ncbi:MAG TPA: N-acetylmuramidase domain-containing protein [Micropepsaceae bacterium]